MKGHVRERGAGNWYAVIDLRDPTTGKRKRKWHSLEAKGKREAQIECARLISDLDSGTYMEPSKTTMAQYLDRWLDHIKSQVSPRSHERYVEIARKNLAPLIGGVVLSKLQPTQISAAYAKALASGRRDGSGGLSPRTVHHMHRVLKQALEQAVKWQLCPTILPMRLIRPRSSGGKCRPTTWLRQRQWWTAAAHTRMFIPTLLAVLCGLRRGEIAALRWGMSILSAGQLSVVESVEQMNKATRLKETKSGRARTVALSTTVIEDLKAWRTQQAQELA